MKREVGLKDICSEEEKKTCFLLLDQAIGEDHPSLSSRSSTVSAWGSLAVEADCLGQSELRKTDGREPQLSSLACSMPPSNGEGYVWTKETIARTQK